MRYTKIAKQNCLNFKPRPHLLNTILPDSAFRITMNVGIHSFLHVIFESKGIPSQILPLDWAEFYLNSCLIVGNYLNHCLKGTHMPSPLLLRGDRFCRSIGIKCCLFFEVFLLLGLVGISIYCLPLLGIRQMLPVSFCLPLNRVRIIEDLHT